MARKRTKSRKKKLRPRKYVLYYIIFLIIFLSVGAVLSLTVFFNLEQVIVDGCDRYSAQELVEFTGLNDTDNLLRVDTASIE